MIVMMFMLMIAAHFLVSTSSVVFHIHFILMSLLDEFTFLLFFFVLPLVNVILIVSILLLILSLFSSSVLI